MGYTAESPIKIMNAVDAIGFYVCGDNKLSVSCRLWDGLNGLPKNEVESLVARLNEAIRPILDEVSLGYCDKAMRELEAAKQTKTSPE